MAENENIGETPEPVASDDGGKKFDEKYVKELREEAKNTRLELKAQKEASEKFSGELTAMKQAAEDQKAALAKALGLAPDDDTTDPMKALNDELKAMKNKVEEWETKATKATEKAQKMALTTEVQKAALELGLAEGVNALDVLPFIESGAVTYNSETETVEGAKEAVDALAKAKPYFFNTENAKTAISTPGGGTPVRRPGDGNAEPTTVEGRMLKMERERLRNAKGFNPAASPVTPRVGTQIPS